MANEERQVLGERVRSLEDEFFRKEDQRAIERLQELKQRTASREALSKTTGITSDAVLDRLIALGVRPETASALSIVPLVEVAWADGSLSGKERQAVLEGASKAGIAAGSAEHDLLRSWLEQKPGPTLVSAWTEMVHGLATQMSVEQVATLKRGLLDRAQAVARASGGLMGIGAISASERDAIARLESAFK